MAPRPGYWRLSNRRLSSSSIEGAPAGPTASLTSAIARSVLVPPTSPARTCIVRAPYKTGPEDQAARDGGPAACLRKGSRAPYRGGPEVGHADDGLVCGSR